MVFDILNGRLSTAVGRSRRLAADPRGALALASVGWTVDLALLALLVCLTAAFGRGFAKFGPGLHPIYITELFLIAIAATAVRRCGMQGALDRLRRLPLAAVLVLWLAGAIATVRGVLGWGISNVFHDVGLVEYSLLVAVVAVVADTRERALRLVQTLLIAGVVCAVSYDIALRTTPLASFGPWQNPQVAVGIYLSLAILLVVARVATRARVRALELVGGVGALWVLALLGARSIVAALAVALLAVVLLMPRHRLAALAGGIAITTVYVVGPWALNGFPPGAPEAPPPPPPAVAAPNWVGDDALTQFTGAAFVYNDAARGHESRQAAPGQPLNLAALSGLQPRKPYTVVFWVKPLARVVTTGRIGDTSGAGWGVQRWTAAPSVRWQRFRAQLVAEAPVERLAFLTDSGASVRVDGVEVLRRRLVGATGNYKPPLMHQLTGLGAGASLAAETVVDLPPPGHLRRGNVYTAVFQVLSAEPAIVRGRIGDTTGSGWSAVSWAAPPTPGWHELREQLVATRATERLAIVVDAGGGVRIRGAHLVSGALGPSGDYQVQTPVAAPSFVADDAETAFSGGTIVTDAAAGTYARQLPLGVPLDLARLSGLRRGKAYTITFSIKPLGVSSIVEGRVGDTSGHGWGVDSWIAAPAERWQTFHKTLIATAPTERLAILADTGSAVRVDAIEVQPGRSSAPAGDYQVQTPVAAPSFVADDAETAFSGGTIVTDAAAGTYARQLP
ncbi:MAG: hypothetical protein ACYDCH_05565, partial [Gaiellaceae bacterium]